MSRMIYKTMILKTCSWALLPLFCCLAFPVLAESPKTAFLNTVTLKGISAEEAFNIVSPDSLFKPVQVDAFFKTFDRKHGATQNSTETESLLKSLKASLEKMDPEHLHTDSALEQLKKYKSQILTVVKKEKQLDELLDYIARLKNVAVKREPAPFSQTPKCDKGPAADYQWPKKQCD